MSKFIWLRSEMPAALVKFPKAHGESTIWDFDIFGSVSDFLDLDRPVAESRFPKRGARRRSEKIKTDTAPHAEMGALSFSEF